MSNKENRREKGDRRSPHPDIPHVEISAPHGGELVRVHSSTLDHLRQRDEMLTALEKEGVRSWDGYKKASDNIQFSMTGDASDE